MHKMIQKFGVLALAVSMLSVTVCIKGESSVTGTDFPDPAGMAFEPLRFNAVKPVVTSLKNGMEFWLIANQTLPLVTLIVDIDAGSLLDPDDKTGVAELTAKTLLTGGTESMTATAFAEKAELMGFDFRARPGDDSTQLSVTCLSTDLEEALAMLMDALQHPRFDGDKLALVRAEAREQLLRMEQQPFFLAFNTLRKQVYGEGHPSARILDKDTLETISRDDLLAFHNAYYHPNVSRFAVIGAADDAAIKHLKKVLGRWKGRAVRNAEWPDPRPASDTARIVLVDRPGTQAVIAMGHLGLEPRHPHRYNLEVFNEIYGGGGMSSRLMNQVRTQKGLAYVVFGSHMLEVPKGMFVAACMTQNSSVADAITTILDVTRHMQSDPVEEDEISKTIESMENSFIFRFERPQQVLQRLLVYRRRGLPDDYLETYLDNIRNVTPESLQQAAVETINLDAVQIIVAGPVDSLKPELETLGLPIEIINRR
jgi:zinc protease